MQNIVLLYSLNANQYDKSAKNMVYVIVTRRYLDYRFYVDVSGVLCHLLTWHKHNESSEFIAGIRAVKWMREKTARHFKLMPILYIVYGDVCSNLTFIFGFSKLLHHFSLLLKEFL